MQRGGRTAPTVLQVGAMCSHRRVFTGARLLLKEINLLKCSFINCWQFPLFSDMADYTVTSGKCRYGSWCLPGRRLQRLWSRQYCTWIVQNASVSSVRAKLLVAGPSIGLSGYVRSCRRPANPCTYQPVTKCQICDLWPSGVLALLRWPLPCEIGITVGL